MKRIPLLAFAVVLIAAALLAFPGRAYAAAADITKQCKFAASSNTSGVRKITDGSLSSVWRSAAGAGQYVDITPKAGLRPGALYIRWDTPPQGWSVTGFDGSGAEAARLAGGADGFLSEYVALPAEFAGCARIRLSSDDPKGIAITELSVFGEGAAPYYAPVWQPFKDRADVMVVSAHPDDDVLYMGAVIPSCAEQGRSAVTVYMTYGKPLRRFEAMEGSWIEGERIQPVMGPFPDTYVLHTTGPIKRTWPEAKALGFLVEQIRKYKPSVVVTHDVKGEYGHGAHLWTSELVQKAFEQAGDASLFPESAARYGAWNAAKLYQHLYKQDKLTIDTRAPLSAYAGKTAYDVAKLAYTRHVSQHVWSFQVRDVGANSIREFGLSASRVGPDAAHTDMFENVSEKAILNLNPWYVYETVDRSALSASISRAEAMRQEDVAPARWAEAGLPAELDAAKAVMENKAAWQDEVDAAVSKLDACVSMLEAGRLKGIAVTSPPRRRAYLIGEALDLTGLAVTGTCRDGSTEPLPVTMEDVSGFCSSAPVSAEAVTVSVGGQSASFTVDVVDLNVILLRTLRLFGFLKGESAG